MLTKSTDKSSQHSICVKFFSCLDTRGFKMLLDKWAVGEFAQAETETDILCQNVIF